MSPRSIWWWLLRWPIRTADQALFAEAFSQALAAGLTEGPALAVATDASPSARFRAALRVAARHGRYGHDLETSLGNSGARVADELLAALGVGEERGGLADALALFARQCDPAVAAKLAEAVGRPPAVCRFAAALARLLAENPLTVGLIEDAGRLAAPERSSFARTLGRVVEDVEGGYSFPEALARQPGTFDQLFCRLVGAAEGRGKLRAVLKRMGHNSGSGSYQLAGSTRHHD